MREMWESEVNEYNTSEGHKSFGVRLIREEYEEERDLNSSLGDIIEGQIKTE